MTLPSCVVVIPTRNRPDVLTKCLGGLLDQTHRDVHVIVVDDCGDVDVSDVIADAGARGLDVELRRQPEQRGPAAARNAGVEAATADVVIFIDDDVVAERHLVRTHLEAVSTADAEPVVVTCGPFVAPADWEPTPWNLWEARQARKEMDAVMTGVYEATWRQFHTGNNALPVATFRAAGGFDTTFTRSEDDEFGARLEALGCAFRFLPGAIAWHYSNRSLEAWLAIPSAYARFDVEIDALHPDRGYLAAKKSELARRKPPLRAARAFFGGRLAPVGISMAVTIAKALFRTGRIDASMGALSVAYDLSYVSSLHAAESGRAT